MSDPRLANDFTEPTARMPVSTLKRLAADAGVRDLRGLEKGQLPAVIKRARLDTHGVDWRVDVKDLSVSVETRVEELPREDRVYHLRWNVLNPLRDKKRYAKVKAASKKAFLGQAGYRKERLAVEALLDDEEAGAIMAAQADAYGMAAPVSVKVVGPRRVDRFLPDVEPDENDDGSDRFETLDEDFVVCTLSQGASLMLVNGQATYTLEPDEGKASEPVTVGVLIDAIETVALDGAIIKHEHGVPVDLAHPFCEMRAQERPKGYAAARLLAKQAVVNISWGS
jgi:hypothetical protein